MSKTTLTEPKRFAAKPVRPLRVVFYCHNLMGLGHIVRSMHLARAVRSTANVDCRILTGCSVLDQITIPEGVQIERLVPVRLEGLSIVAVNPADGLRPMEHRARQITAFVRAFRPDVVVVDHLPFGLNAELIPCLESARREGWATRFVWGMPYGPAKGAVAPKRPSILQILSRYDAILAYGQPDIEPIIEAYEAIGYRLPSERAYVGYVAGAAPDPGPPSVPPLLVGLSGSGDTGASLYDRLLDVVQLRVEAGALRLRLVIGPLAQPGPRVVEAGRLGCIEVWRTGSVTEAVRGASVVVSRVGYNTTFALLQTQLPIVFCPCKRPDGEQEARSQALAHVDNVWAVRERDGVENFTRAVNAALEAQHRPRPLKLSLDGAIRSAERIVALAECVRGAEARIGTAN